MSPHIIKSGPKSNKIAWFKKISFDLFIKNFNSFSINGTSLSGLNL
jgi:hypothetical protein